MDPELRAALYARTHGYCDVCGAGMGEHEMATHHRKTLRRGGSWHLSNLLGAHHRCHNGDTGSIHLAPAKAAAAGFLVATWEEPRLKPVLLHRARWVALHDDGTAVPLPKHQPEEET